MDMTDSRIPVEIFIPKYAKLSTQMRLGIFISLIIGPCFSYFFFDQLFRLISGGITRILDVMLLAIFAMFGSIWLIWVYQTLTKISRLEFSEKCFVVYRRFGFSKTYDYADVIDIHPQSVKIGRTALRFSFFENGQELYEIFMDLVDTNKIE